MADFSTDFLFVYGTLLKGSENLMAAFLHEKSEPEGPGSMEGNLYKVDFYPGAVFEKGANRWVKGEVHRLLDPPKILEVLDGYEGYEASDPDNSLFRRIVAPIRMEEGWLTCWTYVYNQPTNRMLHITSGDFLGFELDGK